MRTLRLDRLKEGLPEITPVFGAFLAEAAAVCLHQMGHRTGVRLKVDGDFETEFAVEWTQPIGKREKLSWNDLKEATEYAATALSLLVMRELVGFEHYVRQEQSQVGDFNLYESEEQFKKGKSASAKVEITGILMETPSNTVEVRLSLKKQQVRRLGSQNQLPVYVVVVEFSVPKIKIVKA